MFYWIVKALCQPLSRLYLGMRREGVENVPRRGPVIIVSNHVSYLDPILLGTASPRPIHFIVLQWMYDLVLLRWFYWGMETVPVRAGGRDSKVIRRALKVLDRGKVLGIFPEGTRSPDGRVGTTRPGAAMIAALSGAPVVPVFLAGVAEALPVGGRFPFPARARVRFGPAMRFPSEASARNRTQLRQFAQAMEAAIRRLTPVA